MRKCRRYSGACDFGFAIADCGLKDPREDARTQSRAFDYPLVIFTLLMFILQRIDKERRCKRPVAECFVRFLLNRAEAIYSQNVSKPLARMADCFPASIAMSGSDCYRNGVLYLHNNFGFVARLRSDRIFVPRPRPLVPLKKSMENPIVMKEYQWKEYSLTNY